MYIQIEKDTETLGHHAAVYAAKVLNRAITERGEARLMAATGASQLPLFASLIQQEIDWSRVTVFHQDEYIGISAAHKASFRGYLQTRFIDKVHPKAFYPVDGTADVTAHIAELSALVAKAPIDLSFIGFGENAHIAFNDPPADFETQEIYKVVELEERCKRQQVREGWFETIDDVPKRAITLSVPQILRSRSILTFVPYAVKSEAVYKVFTNDITPLIPATVLKSHADWHLYMDADAAREIIRL